MSDFYSIKDPCLELKHGKHYLCVDDWDNVFLAEYDAAVDRFFINYESDHVQQRINFIFNQEDGYYHSDEPALSFHGNRNTREDYNALRGNKIEKVRLFELDIRGIKL